MNVIQFAILKTERLLQKSTKNVINSEKSPCQKTTIGEHIEENHRSEDSFIDPTSVCE